MGLLFPFYLIWILCEIITTYLTNFLKHWYIDGFILEDFGEWSANISFIFLLICLLTFY